MFDPTESCDPLTKIAWAKFDPHTGDWYPLYAHLEDTAEVARLLFDEWLSASQLAILTQTFGSKELAKKLAVWIAATHDVGKATNAFAMKAPPCRSRMEGAGYKFLEPDPTPDDQRSYPHGLAGQLAVLAYLKEKAPGGRAARAAKRLAEVVGGHHGAFPEKKEAPYVFTHGEDPGWGRVRTDLLNRADRLAHLDEQEWQQILGGRIPELTQALLTGFLIVCDWIASNQWDFPYDDDRTSAERAADALDRLDFGAHWRPDRIDSADLYFAERFGIPSPRPVQQQAVALAAELEEPSLILIEAPTGEGKTEMGLVCAETLAAKFGLHGAMVALPTRATANAMFGRVLSWLRSGEHDGSTVSVSLAHAKAQFDEQFQALFDHDRNRPRYTYDDDWIGFETDEAVVANQWFSGRKRSGLADFVIGTIDQQLFMTLKAKHLVLRHLGFSSKVIIIDEVHAADDFMRTYLLRALQWLGAYGVPVIALSATLPPAQRRDLLHAYRQGAKQGRHAVMIDDEPVEETITALAEADGYPLVTAVGADHHRQISPERSGRRADYALEEVDDEKLIDAVLREAEAGGCIAVVRNTVQRAQSVYEQLRQRYDSDNIVLFHSRFTVESRNDREQKLVEQLGPRPDQRPKAMIVVATQVVESSLDVDFDLMFTDIAPTDLLIQRIGRVHRHQRAAEERPASMRSPRVVLSGGAGLLAGEEPPEFDTGVQRVYGDAMLLRSVAALRRNRERVGADRIRVPEDVPDLIRDTYREEAAPLLGWESRQADAEAELRAKVSDQQQRSRSYVIGPPGVGGIDDWNRLSYSEASEEQLGAAQVRDADLSIEVVIVQEIEGVCRALSWLPEPHTGEQVDLTAGIEEDLARVVATCTVSLPSWMTQGAALDRVLDDLERNGIEGWQRSIWLRGMLPLVLDADLCAVVNGYRVRYDRDLGLLIEGKDEA